MKTNPNTQTKTFKNVGIDVGKSMLDIHIHELEEYFQFNNNPVDIKALVSKLARFKIARIIVEATGGYERALVEALAERELPVIVIQPKKIRDFANAQGVIAKTDKIDARIIADFGATMKPEPRKLQSAEIRYIRDMLARRRQLMEPRTQEMNRIQRAPKSISRSHTAMIKFLDVTSTIKLTH